MKEEKVTVYKAVRVLPDGRRVSRFIENGEEWLRPRCVRLEYKRGRITRAPKGSAGVFCYASVGEAQERIGDTCKGFRGIVEVYEAFPRARLGVGSDPLDFPVCQAIKLGEKVAEYEHSWDYTFIHSQKNP